MSLHPAFKKTRKIKYLPDGNEPGRRSIRQVGEGFEGLFFEQQEIILKITYQSKQLVRATPLII